MNIVIVISSLGPGGAERVVAHMANDWAARGRHHVRIVTFDDERSPFYRLHENVVLEPLQLLWPSRHVLHSVWSNLKRTSRLRRAVLHHRPDVIISFMDTTNVRTLAALLGSGVPVVVSERSDPRMQSVGRGWSILRMLSYPMAEKIVVQSPRVQEFFPR